MPALIRACRPRQWSKNLLVFAAPMFAFRFQSVELWWAVAVSLMCFCLLSSAVYLLNDSLDVEADRMHPRKRYRPIAAGLVSVPQALLTSLGFVILSLLLGLTVALPLAAVLLLYLVIQLAYCFRLKREPLLDLFCIASGFLLRAVGGGVAAQLALSPWFLLTVGLLALFLAVEKRKAELNLAEETGVLTRSVLTRYSIPLLLRLETLVATSAFISYSLWAAGPALNGASTSWMLLTVPFVLVGIFRYQLLSDPQEAQRRRHSLEVSGVTTESPEEILFADQGIRLTVLAWLGVTALIGVMVS